MKSIKVLLLWCLFLIADSLVANDDILKITTDTLQQGKEVNAIYYKRSSEDNQIFIRFLYYIKSDNRVYTFHSKLPYYKNSEYLKFRDTVPENASACIIAIYSENEPDEIERTDIIPIFNNSDYAEGAIPSTLSLPAYVDQYLHYVELSKRLYPLDFTIYASKWLLELSEKTMSDSILSSDLININKSGYSIEQKNILYFIGNSLLNRRIDSIDLSNILKIKNSENLNNENICISIDNILKKYLTSEYSNIISEICYNNPTSRVSQVKIASGELRRAISPDSLIYIIQQNYNMYPMQSEWIIKYMSAIANDSPYVALDYAKELSSRLGDNKRIKYNFDGNNYLHLLSGITIGAISDASIKIDKNQEGIRLIKEYEEYIDKMDKMKYSFWAVEIATLYESISTDSTLYYYALANKINPEFPPIHKKVKQYFDRRMPNVKDPIKYLDSLSSILENNSNVEILDAPILELTNGSTINLSNSKDTYIIIKTMNGCKPCEKELKMIFSSQVVQEIKPIIIFTNNENYELQISNSAVPEGVSVLSLTNGIEIERYFKLTSSPELIIIKNNKIVLKSSGFGGNIDTINHFIK